MKVVVDTDLCEANARCMNACPEVFKVEEDDSLTLLMETIPQPLQQQCRMAARICPRQAIRLED